MLRLPLQDAEVVLYPRVDLPLPDADLAADLRQRLPWQQPTLRMFGRTVAQPRLVVWMGDPGATYRYSGTTWTPEPWDPVVLDLRHRVEGLVGHPFNSVLINAYRDGQDAMGAHSDDEPELGPAPVIASLSLGAARTFAFASRHEPRQPAYRLTLPGGSLLVMRGTTQRWWKHRIPRTRRPVDLRVNLTFRLIRHPAR